MNEKIKILVLDCWTMKAMSVVRSLGMKNIEVHTTSHKKIGAAQYSSFVHRRFSISDSKTKPENFIEELLVILKSNRYDLIIPLEESSILAVLKNKALIENLSTFLLPSLEDFEKANDKWIALEEAKKIGIPIPKSFLPSNELELEEAIRGLVFPIILKPINSSGSRGIKKVHNRKEFDTHYASIKKNYGAPIIQECIDQEGQGLGVGALLSKGNVVLSYSYKRLREFPLSGGPSTLRESTNDLLLKEYASQLLKKFNWTGVAMVEFKMDPKDGLAKLMEINPRFWGSLALAQASGINFPYAMLQLAGENQIEKIEFKIGKRSRWFFPGDLAHFISNPKRFSMQPSFFSFFEKNTSYDDFDSKDIKGSIAVILCTMLSIFDLETWKLGVFRK